MYKKILALASVLILVMTSATFSNADKSYAESSKEIKKELEELENKKNEVNNQKGEINSKKEDTESKLQQNQEQQKTIKAQIQNINQQISSTETKIANKEKEIAQTEEEIKKLKNSIVDLQDRIQKRDQLLKDRLRSIQQNGGQISYLEVILGAKDFGEFIDRSSAVSTIMGQDKKIMELQKEEKQELEVAKAEVEEKKASLVEQKDSLVALKADLNSQLAQKQTLMAQLEEEEKHLHELKMTLEEEAQLLASQEKAFEQLIAKRQQEYEQAKQAEALAAEQAKQGQQGSGGDIPPISDGTFTRPAAGVVTSEFAPRWGKFHYGIDIAKRGDVPIVASASGIVTRSYYSGSYGNAVFISHDVNGQLITTVYAHMRNRLVSEGQWVEKGQIIGYMGSTGDSTGQHLHFEIHPGGWNASKSNAVNPRNYVNF
jgi:peptidoglycan hydrolase CwlO-like protein